MSRDCRLSCIGLPTDDVAAHTAAHGIDLASLFQISLPIPLRIARQWFFQVMPAPFAICWIR